MEKHINLWSKLPAREGFFLVSTTRAATLFQSVGEYESWKFMWLTFGWWKNWDLPKNPENFRPPWTINKSYFEGKKFLLQINLVKNSFPDFVFFSTILNFLFQLFLSSAVCTILSLCRPQFNHLTRPGGAFLEQSLKIFWKHLQHKYTLISRLGVPWIIIDYYGRSCHYNPLLWQI